MKVSVTVNGTEHSREVEPRTLLVHFLRDELGLTGTHWGCDTSNCGACVVLMDGEPVKSCTVLAATAGAYAVTTVEGLEIDGELDPIQEGFRQEHGLQCGFCTPGMLLTSRALLDRHAGGAAPTDGEIREALSGQICRCTGYTTIVRSVRWAAQVGDRGSQASYSDLQVGDRGSQASYSDLQVGDRGSQASHSDLEHEVSSEEGEKDMMEGAR
jgi:carbon-monoxide dehydrogenase small subunit